MQNKIHIINSTDGDWIGMYVDGVLQLEGHSIDVVSALKKLGFDVTTETKDDEWFEEHGYHCPEKL